MGLKRTFTAVLVAACLSALFLAGCGRSFAKGDGSAGYSPEEASAGYDSEYYGDEAVVDAAEAPLSSAGGLLKAQQESDKLIYSANLTMQTLKYEQTMESIHKKISDCDGFVQYEDESDNNYNWYNSSSSGSTRYAEIEARIPSDSFESFLSSLEGDGQIMNRHVNVDNITQSYSETSATVKAYEIERDRLLDMMDRAETIEDMIAVEERLSQVESELNIYKTSLAGMDRDVEYSTVHISVEEVHKYTEEPDNSTFFSRLKETIKNSWHAFLRFLEGFLHLLIYLLPFIILVLVIFLIVRAIVKKVDRNRPQRMAKKQEQKLQKIQIKQQQKQQKIQYKEQQKMMRHQGPPQMTDGQPPSTQDTQQAFGKPEELERQKPADRDPK